jgi:two-component system cell cycle response regulator
VVLRDGRGSKIGVLRAVRDLRPIRHLEDELLRVRSLLNDERVAKADLSVRDPATGLVNRREIQRILHEEMGNPGQHPLSVMLLEVDYLVPIVERYGAARGDEILREIGKECERVFRVEDRVGRFDGERLLLVLPKTEAQMALRPAERLREAIDKRRFAIAEVNASLTISLGIAETPGDAEMESTLVSAASFALCEAKGRGRNCTVRFSELGSCDRFDVSPDA